MGRKNSVVSKTKKKLFKTRFNYRDRLFLLFAFVFSATLGFLAYKNLAETSAVHAAYNGFSAGNIISDGVMADYNSMSESDIQNFLKSKNSCNDTNLSKADGYWHLNYHVENGHFVCMADERFDGESAAHIIWQAAQDYKINPRVLIVLLQKEQGLVTDTWPNFNLQYRSATGYGCPDSGDCNADYYGFKNQVRNAAYFYRYILNNGSAYYPVGKRSIKYNPSDSCGSSVVNIQNRATSALYQYTPYQPNSAVLNAGPGVVVNCGAYGNVNFYYYYTQWFGDTHGKELTGITLPGDNIQFKTTSGLALSFDGTGNGASAILANSDSTDSLQQFRPISDGKYYRFQNVRTGRYLDLYNTETSDGTKVELWDGNDTCAQKWLVQNNNSGYRLISACASEAYTKSLDIYGGNTGAVGNPVKLWTDNTSTAQRWGMNDLASAPAAEGTYALKSTSGKTLTPTSETPGNGTSVTIWENSTSTVNRFKLIRLDDGYYHLQNTKTGLYLDVSGAGTSDGTKVQLWAGNDNCSQKWIVNKSSDKYTLKSSCSGKSLDINGGTTGTNNSKIQVWSSNSTNAQKWTLASPTTSQPVANGTYSLNSALGNGQRVDINGSKAVANGTNVQLWSRNGGSNQKFTFTYDSNTGYYTIYNETAKRNLDVASQGANGANIQVYSSGNGCYQKWIIIPINGQYYIASSCSRNVIDAFGGKAEEGTNIGVWSLSGSTNQRWSLDSNTGIAKGPLDEGKYIITSGLGSTLALDISGASARDGANVALWNLHKGGNQQFQLINDPATGNYTMYNASTRRNLDANGAVAKNNTNVSIWSGNSSCAQKWKLTSVGNDHYRISSACNTGFSLDAAGGVAHAGTNVLLWANHNGNNQKWKFTKI